MRFALATAFMLIASAAATATAIAAIPPETQPRCTLQIIVVLAWPGPARPASALVISLARAARVKLSFVRDAGTDSYLYHLSAAGNADSCLHGVERLRGDPRVRSIEFDARRQTHATQ